MGLKDLAVGRKDVFEIPIDLIIFEEGVNPREDFSHMVDIANSIVESGQWDPIEVQLSDGGDFVYGTHGETRYRAVMYANEHLRANIKTMKCIAAPKGIDEFDIMLRHFDRGMLGRPLSAIECAKVYRRLKEEKGMPVSAIADRCRKSDQHIYDHLKLLEAPLSVLEKVRAGEMSADAAIAIAKMEESKRAKALKKLGFDDGEPEEVDTSRERITKKDVETAVDGHPRQISAKEIREYIKTCDLRIGAARRGSKEQEKWEGVRYGLETALGMHDDDWKQKGKDMTPGEMLAKRLSGDESISNKDIEKATEDFFNNAGCSCKCTIEDFKEHQENNK